MMVQSATKVDEHFWFAILIMYWTKYFIKNETEVALD